MGILLRFSSVVVGVWVTARDSCMEIEGFGLEYPRRGFIFHVYIGFGAPSRLSLSLGRLLFVVNDKNPTP